MRGPRDAATVTAPSRFAGNSRKNVALGSLAQRGVRHCGACHRETARCVAREPQSRVERLFDVFNGLAICLTLGRYFGRCTARVRQRLHRPMNDLLYASPPKRQLPSAPIAAAIFPAMGSWPRAGSAESLSVGPRSVLLDWAECLNEHGGHWLCGGNRLEHLPSALRQRLSGGLSLRARR